MELSIALQPAEQLHTLMADQNRDITETIVRERSRLARFIRQRVPDPAEAEDILQDVFFEFIEACRLPGPIEQVGAWLFRVARNRIVDRFRKKREEPFPQLRQFAEDGDSSAADDHDAWLALALPASNAGPEAAFQRAAILDAVSVALAELPVGQRDVFLAHELEGRSFKELAVERGVSLNTLLGWKRLAVLHLRARLQSLYDEQY